MLVTVLDIESVQLYVVVTYSLTKCVVDVPANVCVTFGLPGKLIVTRPVPSPKSHTHWLMYDEKPVGTNDWFVKLTGMPTQLAGEYVKSGTGLGFTVTCLLTEWMHPFELTTVSVTVNVP